jgi:hypothetical protein
MGSPATTEVQITPLSADNRSQPVAWFPFHDTITPLSADNRCQPAAWFPFLDTDNAVSSGY